ncbi:MAG: hypothetical protein DDT21_02288 [Syntrophomonadaceae bacterium]|nr:hypothetical protein [Bacillota bacterium]
MTEFNTSLPTQIDGSVVCPLCNGEGWLILSMFPPDKTIDNLLNMLDELAMLTADKFWAQYNVTLTGLPIDNPDRLLEMRTLVREWLTQL